MSAYYSIGEFSKKTGVTVRGLLLQTRARFRWPTLFRDLRTRARFLFAKPFFGGSLPFGAHSGLDFPNTGSNLIF